MEVIFKGDEFGRAVKQKRVMEMNVELRVLANQLVLSASTLSRVENGYKPDITTFAKLCLWLAMDMNLFFSIKTSKRKSNKK